MEEQNEQSVSDQIVQMTEKKAEKQQKRRSIEEKVGQAKVS